MSLDSYITEREQESFQLNSCAKIIGYSKVRKNVREWYKIFGFQFPHTSENNYRDAWFHYRRLYQEHSAYEVTSQIATFDEHIQRAEKDSMVFFFQRASELLEFWYFLANGRICVDLKGEYLETALRIYDDSIDKPNSWVNLLKRECCHDIVKFTASCIYIGQQRILTDKFRLDAQLLLHDIKNNVLALRMGGAHIVRINEPGEYYSAFEPYFDRLIKFCSEYRIKELLNATDVLERVARNRYICEK